MNALRSHFRPEFLNRVDEIIIFEQLKKEELAGIIQIQLERVRKRLRERGLELVMSQDAVELVAEHGYDPVYGARPLKRAIQRDILDPLSMAILEGRFSEGSAIQVSVHEGRLQFS